MGTVPIPIYVWPRARGKTDTLVNLFMEDPKNHVILTATEQQAQLIRKRLHDLDDESIDLQRAVISVSDMQHGGLHGISPKKVLVDQADQVLQSLLGAHRLAAATWDE